jgi:chemotaxis protein methyltransferase CheR
MVTNNTIPIEQSTTTLSPSQFARISRIVYERCGICLPNGKESLVKSRLLKRLNSLGMTSFSQYVRHLDEDLSDQELGAMIDALTTNKTSFFREFEHFDFIRTQLFPKFIGSRSKLKFWSAGCSTGEEPFSLAILLKEGLPEDTLNRCRILATDISRNVLTHAQAATYAEETIPESHAQLLKKYSHCIKGGSARLYRIQDDVRGMVRFARLNLIDTWPMKGHFDLIMCRNVMFYFDNDIRKTLVRRFWERLKPGGYLFVGHSESLSTSSPEFRYIQPAVYQKREPISNEVRQP